eukprot:scaffold13633_cov64-Phaeocystis_antarctica.AAC.9
MSPFTEAAPNQAASTSERSGRRAASLALTTLIPRLGNTSLSAADWPTVQPGVASSCSAAGLTKVTPSSGSVGTCCSGRPAQKVCGGIARSTTEQAPTTVESPTFAPGMRIDTLARR